MQLKWNTCGKDGHWCSLLELNLDSVGDIDGVYIIWHGGNPSRVVRVGQGDIAERLGRHRNDREITAFSSNGKLFVTWAAVASMAMRDGIERHLAETWHPLVGDAFPDVLPIAVNSPW